MSSFTLYCLDFRSLSICQLLLVYLVSCLLVYVCVFVRVMWLIEWDYYTKIRMSFWCCYRCGPRPDNRFTTFQINIKQRPCNYYSYLYKTGYIMTGCAVINWLYPAWMSKVQILLRWFTVLQKILLLEYHCTQHLPMLLASQFYCSKVRSLKILLQKL